MTFTYQPKTHLSHFNIITSITFIYQLKKQYKNSIFFLAELSLKCFIRLVRFMYFFWSYTKIDWYVIYLSHTLCKTMNYDERRMGETVVHENSLRLIFIGKRESINRVKLNLMFLACEKTAYKTSVINLQIKSKNIIQDVFKLWSHIFPFHFLLLLRKRQK